MQPPSREILKRVPLAEAVLTLWSWAADEEHLGQIFKRYRGRCYAKILSFGFLVYLIRDALLEYPTLPQGELEKIEQLEQLRWMENGTKIRVAEVEHDAVSVDVPEDVARVEKLLQEK